MSVELIPLTKLQGEDNKTCPAMMKANDMRGAQYIGINFFFFFFNAFDSHYILCIKLNIGHQYCIPCHATKETRFQDDWLILTAPLRAGPGWALKGCGDVKVSAAAADDSSAACTTGVCGQQLNLTYLGKECHLIKANLT